MVFGVVKDFLYVACLRENAHEHEHKVRIILGKVRPDDEAIPISESFTEVLHRRALLGIHKLQVLVVPRDQVAALVFAEEALPRLESISDTTAGKRLLSLEEWMVKIFAKDDIQLASKVDTIVSVDGHCLKPLWRDVHTAILSPHKVPGPGWVIRADVGGDPHLPNLEAPESPLDFGDIFATLPGDLPGFVDGFGSTFVKVFGGRRQVREHAATCSRVKGMIFWWLGRILDCLWLGQGIGGKPCSQWLTSGMW